MWLWGDLSWNEEGLVVLLPHILPHRRKQTQVTRRTLPRRVRNVPFQDFPGGPQLGIQFLRQQTQVPGLVRGHPTCRGATKPVCHSCQSPCLELCSKQEKPPQREARTLQLESPCCQNRRNHSHSNQDPAQPKINPFFLRKAMFLLILLPLEPQMP